MLLLETTEGRTICVLMDYKVWGMEQNARRLYNYLQIPGGKDEFIHPTRWWLEHSQAERGHQVLTQKRLIVLGQHRQG